VIVLKMSKIEGKLVSEPDTISRGFVYNKDSEELLRDVNRLITQTVNNLQKGNKNQWNVIKQSIKKSIGQYLYTHTKKRPMILPIIIEI
jgi:ribonuclease J